jgi:type IX secretion system PorP/SprF family membrane protein
MKKYLHTFILVGIFHLNLFSQDIHFSQLFNTPSLVNPANTGSLGDQRAFVTYRDQWRSVTTPFKTYLVSLESVIMGKKTGKNKLSLGGFIYSDKAGDLGFTNNLASLSVSYRLNIGKNMYLSTGLQGGVGQRFLAGNNFEWDNQYDGVSFNNTIAPSQTIRGSSAVIGDYAAGMSWTYSSDVTTLSSSDAKYLSIGLASYHLHKPALFNEKQYRRYTVHAEGYSGINSNVAIHPAGYVFISNQSFEIVVGSNVKYILKESSKYSTLVKGAAVSAGLFYRVKDAIIASAGIEQGNYAMFLSYDITASKMSTVNNGKGAFEITLRFINPKPFGGGKFGRSRI